MTSSELDIPDENFQRRSAADFFHDNKAIAGFDNSLRVVFTSVRELVENGLDAAEKIQRLPKLEVTIELLSAQEIADLLEVDKYSKKESTHQDFLRLSVKDNGSGVPSKDIPDLFGRVLTGSNYGARQTRGRFGLGAKMVLLNAMATVDLPIIVKSRHMKEKDTSEYHLFIDLQKNEPKIDFSTVYDSKDEKAFKESGTLVSVTFTGSWNLAKRYIKEYFHQLSIITPYASFIIKLPDEENLELLRVVDQMPPYPSTMKIHPWGCDITQLKREISYTKAKTMTEFLCDHFEGITPKKAKEFLEFVKIENKDPRKLTGPDIRRIVHDGFLVETDKKKKKKSGEKQSGFNFTRPSGKGLSPLGEDRLKRGLAKELDPFLVEAVARPVNAYSGHAFIIEAALAYGGKQLEEEKDDLTGKSSVRIYRFANRIPLLFGAGNDVITKVINDPSLVSWKDYKINLNSSPIAIAVSLVSSKIPFPETSKEYLSDVEEIREEIAQALKSLGVKIRTHLSRRERADRERQRKSRFERFAPIVSDAMVEILQENDEQPYELDKLGILLTRALVEGIPKSAQHRKPPSNSIRKIKYWIDFPDNRREHLLDMNVITLADFLATPDNKLVMKSLPLERVREIKRVTIEELDEEINTPRVTELALIPPEIEAGFPQYEKSDKSLSRRWITTVYDFFVTPEHDFLKVRGFNEKLWSLFKRDMIVYLKDTGTLGKHEFSLPNISWMEDDIAEEFRKNSIETIPDFLLAFSNAFLNAKKFPHFQRFVLTYIRTDVRQKIDILDDNLNANMVTWLTGSSKKALNVKKLKTWQDLVDTIDATPKTVLANEELIITVINTIKATLVEEYNKNDSKLLLSDIEFFTKEQVSACKKQKIFSLYDVLLSELFPSDEVFTDYFDTFRINKLNEFNRKVVPLVSELVWIPTEIEDALNKNGVYSIYDFLITPTHKLHEFSKNLVEVQIIKEIKQQYGIPLNYLSNSLRTILNEHDIITTEELMNLEEDDLAIFDQKTIDEILQIQNTLMRPLICIPDFPFAKLHALYHMGIMSLYDFLIWPETEIIKSQLPEYEIFMLKNKLNLEEIEKLYTYHTKDLSSLGFLNKKLVTLIETIGLIKVEDVLFKNHFILEDIFIENDINQNDRAPYVDAILKLRRSILSPIIFLPEFKFTKIREVLNKNIRTIMDFLYWPVEDLQDLFEGEADIEAMRKNISSLKKGIPLESTKFFSGPEISGLKSENINYLEEVYFTLNRQTFAVPRVDWSRIRDTKSMLNLPVGLIVFEETISKGKTDEGQEITSVIDKPISHDLVRKLNRANINTILEFLIVPADQLATALGVSEKEALSTQAQLKVKSEEEKMELDENVLGFPKSVIRELDSLDIGTLEGLYFASDDILDESPEVKKTVYSIKRALQSSLRLLPEFTPEIRKKLATINIATIATFLMSPTNEIAQLLNITEDRVEETYKIGINVYNLSQLLDNSLSIVPEISSSTLLKLRQLGITTIGHLLALTPEKLAELLDDKVVNTVYHSIEPEDIEKYASTAVTYLEQYFSKSYTRKILRAGFASIQEIVYFAQKEDFIGDDDVWSEIETVSSVLKLPAEFFVSKKHLPIVRELIEAKFVNVIDILTLSVDALPKSIKITQEDIDSIIHELDVEKLIKVTKVPIQVIPGLDGEIRKKLIADTITNVGKLLLESRSRIESITGWSKEERQNFYKNFDVPKLIKSLEISPASVLELESSQSLTLSRKRITKLLDVISMKASDLSEILNISEQEADKILKSVDWDEYAEIMSGNILLIYEIPSAWKGQLLKNEITTLSKYLTEDESELSNILGNSERSISNNKNSISIHSIKSNWKKHQKWIDLLRSYLFAKDTIKTSPTTITVNETEIETSELIKIVELPLTNFQVLDSAYKKKLIDNKIITVRDVISSNVDDLAKILRIDNVIGSIYDKISLKNMMGDFTEPVKLDDIPLMTKQITDKLQSYNLTTIEKIFTYYDQTDQLPEDLAEIIPRLYRTLQQPIVLLPYLAHEQKKTLLDNGYKNLTDLIRANEEDVATCLNMSTTELQKYYKKLNIQQLEHERITSGNLINSLNAFTESVVSSLSGLVKFKDLTFEELFLMNSKLNFNKSDQSQVDRMREAYFGPLVYDYLITEENPEILDKILDKGFKFIYEFTLFSGSKLSNALELGDDITRKLRYNLDFDKVKKYIKREALPLKEPFPLIDINAEDLKKAKKIGLTTWQELTFPQLFLLPEEERAWAKSMEAKLQELFKLPVSRLDGIKISTVPNLTNKGINTIGDFIFGSSKLIKSATRLSTEEYNSIRESPKLSTKKSLEDTLDKIIEKAAETKPEPRKEPAKQVIKTTPTKSSSSKRPSVSSNRKAELQKARESLLKSKKLDTFTPPVKTKKEVKPKEMGSIKHLGPKGIKPKTGVSSKKSTKKSSKK